MIANLFIYYYAMNLIKNVLFANISMRKIDVFGFHYKDDIDKSYEENF